MNMKLTRALARRAYLPSCTSRRFLTAFWLAAFFAASSQASAAVLTWDGSTGTTGIQNGPGPWDTTSNNRWFNGTSYQLWNNATPDSAILGTGTGNPGIVTIDAGGINVASILFETNTSGSFYNINGPGTLTLVGTTPTITNNKNAFINTTIGGSSGLTKAGGSMLTLTGANSYNGTTTINGGTLMLDFSLNSLSSDILLSGQSLTIGNGTLSVKGRSSVVTSQTVGNFSIAANSSSNIVMNNNGGTSTTLVLGNTWLRGASSGLYVDLSASGTISSNPSSNPVVNGIIPWMAVRDSTGTGFGTIVAGNIVRNTATTTLTNTVSGADSTIVFRVATGTTTLTTAVGNRQAYALEFDTSAKAVLSLNSGVRLSLGSNSIVVGAGTGAIISGPGKIGDDNVDILVQVVGGGSLTIGADNSASNLATIGGGTGTLTKTGSGTLILNSNNTYTGMTRVLDGTLQLGTNTTGGPGNVAGDVFIESTAQVVLWGASNRTLAGQISGGGSLNKTSTFSNIWTVSGNNLFTGVTTVTGGNMLIAHSNALGSTVNGTTVSGSVSTLGLSGNIAVGNESLTLNASTGNGTGSTNWGGITNNPNGILRNDSGDNSWAGPVSLSTIATIYSAAGSLTMVGDFTATNRLLTINGPGSVTLNGNLNLGATGAVTKDGLGTLTLGGAANSYGGTTTVNAGILKLNTASLANSSVSVQSAGTLTGTGTVKDLAIFGTFSPGASPGTVTSLGNVNIGSSGSILNFEIENLSSFDILQGGAGSQQITFDGTLNVALGGGVTSGNYKIFDFETYIGNFLTVNITGLQSGWSASFDQFTGTVNVSAVPEPSTFALLGLGMGLGLVVMRRRRMAKHL